MPVVSVLAGCSYPPSKLKDIEERLVSLGGKSAPLRYLDNVQDGEDVNALLGDLQEAVNDYMVRPPRRDTLPNVDLDNRWYNKCGSTIKGASLW